MLLSERYRISIESVGEVSLETFDRFITNEEYRGYFHKYPGEHYKLLAYLSNAKDDVLLFDVGTLKGYSALALSYNPKNKVVSYNVVEERELQHEEELSNIDYVVGDVMEDPRLIDSEIILLDTYHEGTFERKFLRRLEAINYKGLVILDDIYFNPEMVSFWQEVEQEKEDITSRGHSSGTGLVLFD